ncbi:hypothetical protein ZWY2020_020048 [Hordeum vulgare]|nr:hypothetical protein ZWY2020_020048 [Hordeum vulgare]
MAPPRGGASWHRLPASELLPGARRRTGRMATLWRDGVDCQTDWRSSRPGGSDWRRDAGSPGRPAPDRRAADPPAAQALAKKKKKPKKKKVPAATPGGSGCPNPAEVPEEAAPEPPVRAGRQRSREDTMCMNCGCAGHFRSECEAPPRCPTTLAYLGYGTERGSFYFMDAEIEEEAARTHLATVTLAPEQATLAGLAAAAEPDPVPPLEKVWVLVYGLPRGGSAAPWGGKLTHILKAISEPVGKLITADQASFEDDGPARIEILCPAPTEIDGLSLVFYFGSKGRRLTFELESPTPVDPLGLSPAGPKPGDGGLDGEGVLRRRVRLLRELMLHEGLRPIRLMVGGTQPLRPLDHRAPQGVPQSWRWCRCRR